ncbi:MAG: efflux RND transporter permease subunit, partial [Nocardioidaceae bacterium]
MRRVVGGSLRFRWLVVFAALATMVLGLAEIPGTKVDVFPEFAPPRIEIQTIALGNSSNEVEELITVPIENQLGGIEGLEAIRSKSVAQLSSIVLIFERGADELRARQLVTERIAQITPTLPSWASPPFMMPALSSTSRIMKIGLTSDSVNLIDLSTISYWKIRARLLRVPGVAQVAIWGERLPQRHIQVDPAKLTENDVSLLQIMDAAADSVEAGLLQYSEGAVVGTGGFVETANTRFNINHVQPIVAPEQLGEVPVVERDGKVLRIADFGNVLVDHGPLWGDAVINDGPGIMLIVQKFRGANTMEVTRGVEDAMEDLAPGLPGIEYDTTIFRPATFIEQSIDNLTRAMLLGILLVMLIIIAFVFEWRTAFISLIAIPLSLVSAVLVLDLRGETINVMVLAGLVVAIGVVVDDAIIDVENVVRRLRQHREAGDTNTFRTVLEASVEVRSAITYATIINIVAVVPVLFLEGLSGSFFRPLVLTYSLAVLVSMVVALTVTPALCLLLLSRGHLRTKESPVLRVLKRGYAFVLTPLLRWTSPAFAGAAVVALLGVLVYPTLGTQLLPNFKERDFLMHWLTQPGTSMPEETRVSVAACKDLREIPGVRNCGSHIGQALLADEVYGVDFGENWISVSEDVDYDETLGEVQATVDAYPGLYRDVQTYLRERIKEVLTGSSEAIVVRIYGPDLETLREKAHEIAEQIADIDGVIDAHASLQTDLAHIEVEPDLDAARAYGLTPGEIRRQSSVLIASEEVSDIFAGGKAYDVHIWTIP